MAIPCAVPPRILVLKRPSISLNVTGLLRFGFFPGHPIDAVAVWGATGQVEGKRECQKIRSEHLREVSTCSFIEFRPIRLVFVSEHSNRRLVIQNQYNVVAGKIELQHPHK